MRKIVSIILLGLLLFPLVSLAGEYKACKEIKNGECIGERTVSYEGLVPCGKEVAVNNKRVDIPCQFCHIFVMADAILDFVIGIAFIIAVGMIVLAGLLFIVAYSGIGGYLSKETGGGPKLLSQAKSILGSVLTGLVIIFAAWIIVNTIFVFLGVADWALGFTGPGKWSQIDCPIELPQ